MTQPKFILACTLAIAVIALADRAAAQIKMEIVGPGSKLSAIALPALKNLGGDERQEISRDFIQVLGRDLALSGYFRVLNPEAYIEDPQRSGFEFGQFNFADWSSINAEFLVKGGAAVQGNKVSLEVLLFDVAQHRQLTGRRFSGGRADVARMARRFADAILQATTGVRGPFDSLLACVSTRGGRFKEVYTLAVDGGNFFRITNNPTINLFPSFDRGAHRLLYTSYQTGSPALYLFDLSNRTTSQIRVAEGTLIGGALTPDGESIVAAVERNGVTNLYLIDRSRQAIRQLTRGGSINVTPAVASDGHTLAFTSDRSGTPQIYVTDLAGGEPRRLTYRGNYNTNPAFSPKGDKIAYQSRAGGVFDIYVVATSGGEPTRLTDGIGTNESPHWSPDGRYLVFSSTRGGNARLYLMEAESGRIISPITEEKGDDTSPAWSGWLGE